MSKANPLAGLIGYEDSDDEAEDAAYHTSKAAAEVAGRSMVSAPYPPLPMQACDASMGIHPAPIPHCPWSACYDESSGFTYYWNQLTNAVTWEAPPEYLLALKLAQQQLNSAGSEVSAEEWQLYQQALAEKQNSQNKSIAKTTVAKPAKKNDRPIDNKNKKFANSKKRAASDEDDEKIELITSYYHSDSESNEEPDPPVKVKSSPPHPPAKLPKHTHKKQKVTPPSEYGPSLPPNQSYTVPIGPELPPVSISEIKPTVVEKKEVVIKEEEKKSTKITENEDSQDESLLLLKLKDKAKLLEKLGGEIPTELQKIIQDETRSRTASPKIAEDNKATLDTNIDDLLEEIEKKELPKVKSKIKIDIFDDALKSKESSSRNSPRSSEDLTPPREELKSLFPSSKAIVEEPEKTTSLFPSAQNIQENEIETKPKSETPPLPEKKPTNIYLIDNDTVEKPSRKKLRISNSVLPERKKADVPAYTTKYSQYIEGFSSERTGLGFSKEEESDTNSKSTINYGNGLAFTKGETLNEDKKDEALDDLSDLVEAKLKYLNQLQPCIVTPVQEMLIQMQTLVSAYRSGAVSGAYWRRWCSEAGAALRAHELRAAPPGWLCAFDRSSQRYRYRRQADGLEQWEYPAVADTDMDICTTPPHPGVEREEPPPLPAPPLPPPPPPSPPRTPAAPAPAPAAPAPATPPPPPAWHDPPPPGCDELPPLPPEPPKLKQEIGDELLSFYNDIAELEKTTPPTAVDDYPATPPPPPPPDCKDWGNGEKVKEKEKEKEREARDAKISKKKSKVKISSSIGMKHKSVSNMVAKWQQVADEINSD